MPKPNIKDILEKHSARIEGQIRSEGVHARNINYSREYLTFKQEMAPELNHYEQWCRSLGNAIKMKISPKEEKKIRKQLEISHLDVQPSQAFTLSFMAFLATFVLGLMVSFAVFLIKGTFPILFFFLIAIVSIFLFYFANGYPTRLANKWRLKASSQMVPAILYVVVYMRHTPNLERAIEFAADHLQMPLALDFKKIFYNVSIGKFSTIKESLDDYLENWRDYSIEFIESFHLIESSLFEPSDERRIASLEKALQVVLDGVYEKMLKFTHEVRSPLTNVYMLGVVLPTLGLALLPLASAMIGDLVKWSNVLILFNLVVPFLVFYLTDKVMFMRPGGYGETELLERSPLYSNFNDKKHYFKAALICVPLFIIGLIPLIFQYTPLPELLGMAKDFSFSQIGLETLGNEKFFDFKETLSGLTGPFGVGALLLSTFIPLSVALFFGIAYKSKTEELIAERNNTKQLEREFNNSLFQLGNRVGNGMPPELAFGRIAESSKGLVTESFFQRVNYNIKQMGMDVERAIFDRKIGAINYYPSELIATSMRILIESSKKGLKIAALSLMSISEYTKNIHKITDRLKDMLAEIASDMKSNMTFLAPLLSGVVIGLAMMITSILNKLSFSDIATADMGIGNIDKLMGIFSVSKMIPPYFLQIIIGFYIIEIIFILTRTLVTVDSGEDRLERINKTAKNLLRGMGLYIITALVAILMLFGLSSIVLGNLVS
jgi:Flp pilus assembly protein TadB